MEFQPISTAEPVLLRSKAHDYNKENDNQNQNDLDHQEDDDDNQDDNVKENNKRKKRDNKIEFLFRKIEGTVKEKIDRRVQRYKNNYFLNQELKTVQEKFHKCLIPKQKVTDELFVQYVNRRETFYSKRFDWILDNIEKEFAVQFKEKYQTNQFKSVNDAYKQAAELYVLHSNDYCSSKATSTASNIAYSGSIDVKYKRLKRKAPDDKELESSSSYQIKEKIASSLKNNFQKILETISLSKKDLKKQLIDNQNNASTEFALECAQKPNVEAINKHEERLAINLTSIMHEIVENII